MSKKSAILIVFLALLAIFFVYVAVSQNTQKSLTNDTAAPVMPTKKPSQAFTTLVLLPKQDSVDVLIDTHGEKNKITAVQLELSYDPTKITAVSIKPGVFLGNSPVLFPSKIDTKAGKITYPMGISPSAKGKSGTGVVATISFQPVGPGTTQIHILPSSLVTAEGITQSVLLKRTDATISLSKTAPVQTKINVVPSQKP